MKKTMIALSAALAALLLAGCTQANAASTVSAASAAATPAPAASQTAEAAAPVAAPASQPTASMAGGAAQDNGYIGEDAALSAALTHAGLAESNLQGSRIKLEYEDGRAVYDVEFYCRTDTDTTEYDYEIDAATGEILAYDYDAENYTVTAGTPVTAQEAKQIALNHAGVAEADTRSMEMETDRDDGRTVYEFSWKVGFTEYEYDIDADTGAILSFSREQDD